MIEWRKNERDPNKKIQTPADIDAEIAAMRDKSARRREEMNAGHTKRITELQAEGEAARRVAMENFDKAAAERAAEGKIRVDAAKQKLADSIEQAKKRAPNVFKDL